MGVLSALAMVPLALLAAGGVLRVVGFVYAIMYAIFVLAPTGQPMLMLIVDALLLLVGRPTLFLGMMVEDTMRAAPLVLPRRTLKRVMAIGLVSAVLNPLTGIALSTLVAVLRLRPHEFVQIWEEARQRALKDPEPMRPAQAQTQAHLVRPVLEPIGEIESELQYC